MNFLPACHYRSCISLAGLLETGSYLPKGKLPPGQKPTPLLDVDLTGAWRLFLVAARHGECGLIPSSLPVRQRCS